MEEWLSRETLNLLNEDFLRIKKDSEADTKELIELIKIGLTFIREIEFNFGLAMSDLTAGVNSTPIVSEEIELYLSSVNQTSLHPTEVIKSMSLIPEIDVLLFEWVNLYLNKKPEAKSFIKNELYMISRLNLYSLSKSKETLNDLIQYVEIWKKEDVLDVEIEHPFSSDRNFRLFCYLETYSKQGSTLSRFTHIYLYYTSEKKEPIQQKVFFDFVEEYMRQKPRDNNFKISKRKHPDVVIDLDYFKSLENDFMVGIGEI